MRIALPKGRLQRPLFEWLKSRGICFIFASARDHRPTSNLTNVTAKVLKARDIPQMVDLDRFDVGFCCLDVVEEAGFCQLLCVPLGISKVRVVALTHYSTRDLLARPPNRPLVIATKYPSLAGRWLASKGLPHIAVGGAGAIEAYPPEDADLIVDIVETNALPGANGLIELETLFCSEACAIMRGNASENPEVEEFLHRLTEREDP